MTNLKLRIKFIPRFLKKKLLNYLSQENANKSRTSFCFDKSFELS